MNNDHSALSPQPSVPPEEDAFDRIYMRWARHALDKRLGVPDRGTWDGIILRLLSSQDPERVRMYRRIEMRGEDSLGGDAFALWCKMPEYMPHRIAPAKTTQQLAAYAEEHRGSMRQLMEAQGLGERYSALAGQSKGASAGTSTAESKADNPAELSAQAQSTQRAQRNVVILGCVGLMTIGFMMMAVLFIIVLKMLQ